MIWLYILIVFFSFVTITLFSKLHIKLKYSHTKDDDQLTIRFRLWFIRYTFNVPLIKIDKETSSIVVKHEGHSGNDQSDSKERSKFKLITPTDIMNAIKDLQDLLQHVIHLHTIIRRFLKGVSIHKLEWQTAFGLGDAALTGMFIGAAWSIKGGVIGILSQYMKLETNPNVTITPYFQNMFSHTKLTCMFSFRIGNAILAGFRIVKFWKGGRPSFRNAPSFLKEKDSDKSFS